MIFCAHYMTYNFVDSTKWMPWKRDVTALVVCCFDGFTHSKLSHSTLDISCHLIKTEKKRKRWPNMFSLLPQDESWSALRDRSSSPSLLWVFGQQIRTRTFCYNYSLVKLFLKCLPCPLSFVLTNDCVNLT